VGTSVYGSCRGSSEDLWSQVVSVCVGLWRQEGRVQVSDGHVVEPRQALLQVGRLDGPGGGPEGKGLDGADRAKDIAA
jgi:hypothetical protein